METTSPPTDRPNSIDWLFRVLGFVALTAMAFKLPAFPTVELDASWRMVLGKVFQDGRQFGTEVVFTYGPLGFLMGNTYWGGQWGSLITWHALLAVIFASIIYWHGFQLRGYARLFFFLFFFTFGVSYQDAMQQIIIALVGLQLIRRSDRPWQWSSIALVALLAGLSLVKFTNIILSVALVGLAAGLELWVRRRPVALRLPLLYGGAFVLGWILCGQNPLNLPSYFRASWEISQGYQDAMGLSCPSRQLYLGLTVLALIVAHAFLNLYSQTDRIRSFALTAGVGAFIYLGWKHGYIRADGHQIGFYYAAMTVAVTSTIMLEDGPRLRLPKRLILIATMLVSLVGLERVLPGLVRGALGGAQFKMDRSVSFALGHSHSRELYEQKRAFQKVGVDLHKTKRLIGDASVDQLGFEQAVVLLNDFNYQPRPVFQGYSAYTPYLSRLNHAFFASDDAPEYVIFKLHTIDGRLSTMDDPDVLRLLVQRYRYLHSELGYTVWQRQPGPFDAAAYEPVPLRSGTVRLGEQYDLADLADLNLWVEIDYHFNFLGKLRRFFFKPPLVQLRIIDDRGMESVHRLPRPIAAGGFMLNPVIDDLMAYMRAAGGDPKRRVSRIAVEPLPQDHIVLQPTVNIRLFSLPESDAGVAYFTEADQALFHMFVDAPVSHQALNPPNEDMIDGRRVMILHAPSEMVFEVPAGARELHGSYGFIPGAYSQGGQTNGAEFVIYWNDGQNDVILLERFLDPVKQIKDRGLQSFKVTLPASSGRVYLRVNPGPFGEFAFDWTGWTGIEFK